MNNQVVIWGASGHAMVVAEIILLENNYSIYGFIDDVNSEPRCTEFGGYEVLGGSEILEKVFEKGIIKTFVAIGDCKARAKLANIMRKKNFQLIKAIHPKSIVSNYAEIGNNTVINAGAVINFGARIGNDVIINTSASIDHHCEVEDGAHVSPGVCCAGYVKIGSLSWIGSGSVILPKVKIGSNCIIGAGSLVRHDIPSNVLVYGSPARIIKDLKE